MSALQSIYEQWLAQQQPPGPASGMGPAGQGPAIAAPANPPMPPIAAPSGGGIADYADPASAYHASIAHLMAAMQPAQHQAVPAPAHASFLENAAPFIASALHALPMAKSPGLGHELANAGSIAAQGLLGGIASGAERRFQSIDARRKEALAANAASDKSAAGNLNAARTEAVQSGRAFFQSKNPKGGPATGVLPAALAPFAPGYKVGDTVPQSVINAAMGAANRKNAGPSNTSPDADQAVDAIYGHTADPSLGMRVTKEAEALRANMRRRHPDFNWAEAQTQWDQKNKFYGTENGQRFTTLRQSAQTLAAHVREYEDFNKQFDAAFTRLPQKYVNRGIMWAAENGHLGPEAQSAAAGLALTRPTVAHEFATAVSGGYAPGQDEIKAADAAISSLWGPVAQKASLQALKKLVRDRVIVAQKAVPFATGKPNPYLLDVTPMDPFPELDAPKKGEADLAKLPGVRKVK